MAEQQPGFSKLPFRAPTGYEWLVARGLAGFEPDTALQPWYLLPAQEVFSVSERWPRPAKCSEIYAFARRQDGDDLACFEVHQESGEPSVLLIHGWTPEGYEVVGRFDSIWEWLRSVIDDIREWSSVDH